MSNAEMDVHKIIGFLDQFEFKHFSIQSKDLQIEAIAPNRGAEVEVQSAVAVMHAGAPVTAARAADAGKQGRNENSGHTYVKSPALGMFAGADNEPPAAIEGKTVKAGDLLGHVRTRDGDKGVLAGKDGEIVKVCVCEGEFVAYGRTLFVVRDAKREVATA